MAYWDTSCLLKLYAPERDSAVFKAHLLAGALTITSFITRLELWAALRRKESLGDLRPGGARLALAAYDADVAAGLIQVAPLDSTVTRHFESIIERCHGRPPPVVLRTLDAIHAATAVASGESEIVATDKRLREAALDIGLTVYPLP